MSSSSPQASEATPTATGWRMEHTFARLPALLHGSAIPTPVRAPRLVVLNRPLAEALGLEPGALEGTEGAEVFSGNRLPPGAAPLAQAYAGHQFGHFTALGDGRAILLGEQVTPRGERFDIQLKGAGPTPFSRRGDGRAALGPMLREYVISEAMASLGIPTTRSLAVVATGESVWRSRELPGAVLTRVAASHLRVGTFQWVAARRDAEALRELVNYALQRHDPELAAARPECPAQALLAAVIDRQAALVAQWMAVGFVHGVMNTDNVAISGETIDYGPCAFIDSYDPATVFSSIDRHGRYAYGRQPEIMHWNLTRLAEALLPLLDPDEAKAITRAEETLDRFEPAYQAAVLAGMRQKLGLFGDDSEDVDLIRELLDWMQRRRADYTQTWSDLTAGLAIKDVRRADQDFMHWHGRWQARLSRQPQTTAEVRRLQRAANPAFVPRNHLVEAALEAAEQGDLVPLERLVQVLQSPFDHDRDAPEYRTGAPDGGEGYQTFCGT
ncbi:MAG: YdiU family protein [Opitutaceae bacterium]|nr:YdiU family protein [Opitutaceae bacterium]